MSKKKVDKQKIAFIIMAGFLALLMVISVAGTLIWVLTNK